MSPRRIKEIGSPVPIDGTYLVIPPDGGWGWIVVFAAFCTNFMVDGVIYTFGIFLQDISKDLKGDEPTLSLANSLLTAMYYIMGPVVCAMTNRLGFRTVTFVGSVIAAGAIVAASYVDRASFFILTYGILTGLGFGMMYISSILAVGFYFDRWRPIATALTVCGSSVSCIVIPPVMNLVLKALDWRKKYWTLSGGVFLAGLLALSYKPIKPIKIIPENMKKFEDDKISLLSLSLQEENPKSIFYKKHNKGFPTNADLVSKNSYTVAALQRARSMDTTISRASFKRYARHQSMQSFYSERMNIIPEEHNATCCTRMKYRCCYCQCNCSLQSQRPMYRDDILYTGSVAVLPTLKPRGGKSTAEMAVEYHMSVTRVISDKDEMQSDRCCICCPEAVIRTLATMLDFSLMKSCSFNMLLFSGAFTFLGIYPPYIFVMEYSKQKGMDPKLATYLIPMIGVTNTLGRIISGAITMVPRVNAMIITQISLFFCGVAAILIVCFGNSYNIFICSGIFGFFLASISSLRPIIAVEMVGLEKLTNAFGLIILFEGFACLLGVPVASKLKEMTNSYVAPFCYAGVCIIFSAVLLIPIKPMMKWEKERVIKKEQKERERRVEETRRKLANINQPKGTKKK